MAYDKKFWDHYNRQTIKQLESLMSSERQTYVVDLHIHTDWSADGEQSVAEVIQRARERKAASITGCSAATTSSLTRMPRKTNKKWRSAILRLITSPTMP